MSEFATWYYVGTFGQLGPLTKEQVEELIEGGVIEKSTFMWKPGMPDWIPASNIPDLDLCFRKIQPFQSPPPFSGSQSTVAPPQGFSSPVFDGSFTPPAANLARGGIGQPQGYNRSQSPYGMSRSDKSRTVAGILQILIPGAGRIYLGYAALGVIQLILSLMSCFILHVWSIVDGILILSGQVRIDGYGRSLDD
jgi:hypothetical protein